MRELFMRICILSLLLTASAFLGAENTTSTTAAEKNSSQHFTGKILKNRVRMRLQPSLDSYVFKEMGKDDLLLVTGEADDFYACMPPKGLKGYIFRTYVLDGIVEGTNVNVRLEPDTTSPVITQLHTGNAVRGTISSKSSKWLEIDLPESVRFYVAKEFVGRLGGPHLFEERLNRLQKVKGELANIEDELALELQKPFDQMQVSHLHSRLQRMAAENTDLPKERAQAELLMAKMQSEYLAKGMAYTPPPKEEAVASPQEKENAQVFVAANAEIPSSPPPPPPPTVTFQEQEARFVKEAIASGKATSKEQLYADEYKTAKQLRGILKPYHSAAKNLPGDFLLLDEKSMHPIAFVYSTEMALQPYVNRVVTLSCSPRPNNNFARPAYFVLKVE